jgi:hypothetical protein
MFVPASVFTDKNGKRKDVTSDTIKHHHHKEESNISEGKVKTCELDINKKI